jgi:rubrerythrin
MSKSIMLTIAAVSIVSLIWLGCGTKEESQAEHQTKEEKMMMTMTAQSDTIYYTCPMPEHKDVGSKVPGKCPKCQMTLVAALQGSAEDHDYYGCPMAAHSYVRSEKPGVCAECGMEYKPIKLVMVDGGM